MASDYSRRGEEASEPKTVPLDPEPVVGHGGGEPTPAKVYIDPDRKVGKDGGHTLRRRD